MVLSMLLFKHISNDDPLRGEFFWGSGDYGVVVTWHHNPKLQRDDLMHPGTTPESPRASDKAFSCCRIFSGWLSVMSDDGRGHVVSKVARLLDQGQRSTQG